MKTKVAMLALTLLLFAIPPSAFSTVAASGPPALFYSLLALNKSKADCLKRANAALATELDGEMFKRTDDVALVNATFNIAIHCRKTSDKSSFVTIIVTHRSSAPSIVSRLQ